MVIEPVLAGQVFGVTVKETVPLPLPLAPEVIDIQDGAVAIQEQVESEAPTFNPEAPPPEGKVGGGDVFRE